MLIGRKVEQDILDRCLRSGRPEFVVVYGRRRVGKTFLVREYFKDGFSFYATGVAGEKTRDQLRAFDASLRLAGSEYRSMPKDWFEAFERLRALLERGDVRRDRASGRIVIFLDELPWLDTARSDFRPAFDFFWNGWASSRDDVMLVACGSAASWMINHLIGDHGGFHNRVTRQIHLKPFTLAECEEFYRANGIAFSRQQIVESYMMFGGVPYYLTLIDRRSSFAQNVDQLCFEESGQLRYEFSHLFASLFKHSGKHEAIVRELAGCAHGMTRAELAAVPGIGDGQQLTKTLEELVQCGFIRRYRSFLKEKNVARYQLIDPFTRFSIRFLEDGAVSSWMGYINSPSYYAWRGAAFESVCLAHAACIKEALRVSGVASEEYSWRSRCSEQGAQVDLVIDRVDGVINLCEIKCADGEFSIDRAYAATLQHKVSAFVAETGTRKAVHLTMITANGLAHNAYSNIVQNELTAQDLFAIQAF